MAYAAAVTCVVLELLTVREERAENSTRRSMT